MDASSYSGSSSDADQKAAQQQMMQLNMIIESQKTMVKLTGLCFDRCISTPGKSLSTSEQTCLWRCAQNMMETNVFMQKRLVQQAKHHVSIVAALVCMAAEWGELSTRAVYGANTEFPFASLLQHINIGYFMYDFIHSLAWEHKFILHHGVTLTGLFTSEYINCFALANAVNTLIAESGSIMYNYYNAHKSLKHYVVFVVVYGISRMIFLLWSCSVFYQAWHPFDGAVFPRWAPYVITILQSSLFTVNLVFLVTHLRKLNRKLSEHRAAMAAESDGDSEVKTAATLSSDLRRRAPVEAAGLAEA